MSRVPIVANYELPGYRSYGGNVPAEISLRAMTTVEEKMRLQTDGLEVMPRLINNCIQNEGVDAFDLKIPDVQRLMYGLRSVTYGPEYSFNIRCPHCGQNVDLEVDLDKLALNFLPEDFDEPFEIGPLPQSGDVIACRLLTIGEYIDMQQEAKNLARTRKTSVDDVLFNLEYKMKIVTVNGEQFFPAKLDEYINTMTLKDLRYFDCRYNEVLNSFGIDTNIVDKCPLCNKEIEYQLPMTDEFFRPKL